MGARDINERLPGRGCRQKGVGMARTVVGSRTEARRNTLTSLLHSDLLRHLPMAKSHLEVDGVRSWVIQSIGVRTQSPQAQSRGQNGGGDANGYNPAHLTFQFPEERVSTYHEFRCPYRGHGVHHLAVRKQPKL